MKYVKEHKVESILLLIILSLLLVFFGIFLFLWYGGTGDLYGNRLNGIENVPISDGYLNDIEKELKKEEIVVKTSSNLKGRLINFLITVKDETNIDEAKEISEIVINGFEEDELDFYDIQIFLLDSGSNEESNYPYIGYKHKSSDKFVWSNN